MIDEGISLTDKAELLLSLQRDRVLCIYSLGGAAEQKKGGESGAASMWFSHAKFLGYVTQQRGRKIVA